MQATKRGRAGRLILAGVLLLAAGGLAAYWFAGRAQPKANPAFTSVKAVRAVRVDYLDLSQSRGQVAALEAQMRQSGVNLVAVGAGRVDWTYFPWAGHSADWSAEVSRTGVDYLGEDSRRFSQWAHVTAVVDALAPRYIQAHPEAAAISWSGAPSPNLVGTMELVEGDFGRRLLALIEAVSANYPVNSVSVAELVYLVDGYGPRDKAAYLAYANRADWPRTAAGDVDIADASLGAWRSYEISRFVEQAAAVTHKYGKQLFLEVRVNQDDLADTAARYGTRYDLMLKYADRLVVWGNYGLGDRPPERLRAVAQSLAAYWPDRVIFSLGLWQPAADAALADKAQQAPIAPEVLQTELAAAGQGGATSFWITPSFLLSPGHWTALKQAWASAPAAP